MYYIKWRITEQSISVFTRCSIFSGNLLTCSTMLATRFISFAALFSFCFCFEPPSCAFENLTPNPCKYCKSNSQCTDGEQCCKSGDRLCCRDPGSPPVGGIAKPCDRAPHPILYLLLASYGQTELPCGFENLAPSPCKSCNSNSECRDGEQCCKSGDRQCCRSPQCCNTPAEPPPVNLACNKTVHMYASCENCIKDADCTRPTDICCNTGTKTCCVGTTEAPCLFENMTPNPCKYCTESSQCPNNERCCKSGNRQCCRKPTEEPIGNLACNKTVHAHASCENCVKDDDCTRPTDICCNTGTKTCCVGTTEPPCDFKNMTPNPCKYCTKNENCPKGERCCKSGDARCCRKPTEEPIVNPACNETVPTFASCENCIIDSHCTNPATICCNVGTSPCCVQNPAFSVSPNCRTKKAQDVPEDYCELCGPNRPTCINGRHCCYIKKLSKGCCTN